MGSSAQRSRPSIFGRLQRLLGQKRQEQEVDFDGDKACPALQLPSIPGAPARPATEQGSPRPSGLGGLTPERERADRREAEVYRAIDEMWSSVTEGSGMLDRPRYVVFHSCMFRALRAGCDEREAQRRAGADFEVDSLGTSSVPKSRFTRMMYALADRWSEGSAAPRASRMAAFLAGLHQSITYLDASSSPPARRMLRPRVIVPGTCVPPQWPQKPQAAAVPARRYTLPAVLRGPSVPRPPSPDGSGSDSCSDADSDEPLPGRSRRSGSAPDLAGAARADGDGDGRRRAQSDCGGSLLRFAIANRARVTSKQALPRALIASS